MPEIRANGQVAEIPGDDILELLSQLNGLNAHLAWSRLLELCGPVILQAIRHCIWDAEQAADCFVFVCERLHDDSYRRLRRFRPTAGCRFETWLRVVVRNLSLDWHRKRFGRWRLFQSLTKLPALAIEVYRLRYEQGLSADEAFGAVRAGRSEVTAAQFYSAEQQVHEALNSRQNWLISARSAAIHEPETLAPLPEAPDIDPQDARPDPESEAMSREQRMMVARAVARLEPSERILLQLRFSQELPLVQIARFAGLRDAQTADRRLRAILQKLRLHLK